MDERRGRYLWLGESNQQPIRHVYQLVWIIHQPILSAARMQDIRKHRRREIKEERMLLPLLLVSHVVSAIWVRWTIVMLLELLQDKVNHALLDKDRDKARLDRDLLQHSDAEA